MIISAIFIFKFSKGESCVGLNCSSKVSPQVNISTFIHQLFTEETNSTFAKNHLHSNIQPFIGITDSRKLNKKCCHNGGTCFLGSFCICPKHFTGRHCENSKRIINCGIVAHGDWIRQKCLICRCLLGVMNCFTPEYEDNCGPRHQEQFSALSGGQRLHQSKLLSIIHLFIFMILQYYCCGQFMICNQ